MKGEYEVEWRPMAKEDLRAIVRYIGKDNPIRAKSFSVEIRKKAKLLAQHPDLGREEEEFGLREWVIHPNYLIIYRKLPDVRKIFVVRVKHAAQQTLFPV